MKIFTILFIAGLLMFPIIGLAQTSATQAPAYFCGDGKCTTDETPTTCEKDCSQPTTIRWDTCGDKICQTTESKSSCSVDCGYPWVCGDGICGGTETDWNCPQDCPKPEVASVYCGDKICQSDESQRGCPVDCGYPLICGDGICNGTDTYNNCPKDCPQPTTVPAPTTFGNTTGGGFGAVSTEPAVKPTSPETSTSKPMIISASEPTTAATVLSPIKCGVNSFGVGSECGAGVYKNVYIQCYDGYEPARGDASSCKSSEAWIQYAKEACTNRCSTGYTPQPSSSPTTPILKPTTSGVSLPTNATVLTSTKCGIISTKFCNECGAGVYKNVFVKCSDGSEITLGSASSCKPADLWNQYAKEVCTNHCSSGGWGGWSDLTSGPIVCAEGVSGAVNRSTSVLPATTKPVEIPKATPVCYISEDLFQKYNLLIIELQKSESDKTRTELITKEIIALKQQIATQQNECVRNSPQPTPTIVPWSAPIKDLWPAKTTSPAPAANLPVAVSINHCNEIAQWETKIAYYKKISSLNNDDLKKSGFSREEIEKITQELSLGIENVRGKCGDQEKTTTVPRATVITGSASIAETIRPIVVESGQEIGAYYKARLEKTVSVKGEDQQIQELKTLRDEIDGLISNLIKSRKELEVSELNTLVKEVKVSRGEIKADDMTVKTTEKKMLMSVGDRPVSIEPTVSQVLIRDKGLEVNTNEVTIKENVLSVGGVEVKMSASEVTEKLGLTPKTIELKEENAKAIYNMTIEERRKLFGFIPFNSQKTITADADNGNTLSEKLPWYNFMTTK